MSKLKAHYPLIVALELFLIVLYVVYSVALMQTDGSLVYALDDPYIHLSMARNFAEHGVWGVTHHGFTSSSSSLLWTLLLAGFYAIGVTSHLVPFFLNVLLSCAVLAMVYAVLRRHRMPPGWNLGLLLAMSFLTPFVSLVFTGLEHVLHILLTLLFLYFGAHAIAGSGGAPGGEFGGEPDGPMIGRRLRPEHWLLMLAPILVMTRFEGIFAAFVVCLVLLVQRRGVYAVTIGGLALLPVGIYGLISTAKGWYFLPNSVVMKSIRPELSIMALLRFLLGQGSGSDAIGIRALMTSPFLLTLVLAALAAALYVYRREQRWSASSVLLVLFLAVTALHLQLARTGWFYRYEAYLIATGLFAIAFGCRTLLEQAPSTPRPAPVRIFTVLLAFLVLYPLVQRGLIATLKAPMASKNIFDQQVQMARFLHQHYPGTPVVLNDIGVISYLGDPPILDLWALASRELASATLEKRLSADQIERVARERGMKIAVIYDAVFYSQPWFTPRNTGIPSSWTKVGEWRILDNVVCGDDDVSFYAIDPADAPGLEAALNTFNRQLPPEVVVRMR